MKSFEDFNISKQLLRAISDLGFQTPTPIQDEAYSVILSGKDIVGISQTGTGKTFAYMLPILQQMSYSEQIAPKVLILVPTRELVLQMVEMINSFSTYINVRVLGVYGGTNINTQKDMVVQGCDILVATPGRLFDLALSGALQLKSVKKLVIDEVDIMLDLGFRPQLTSIFEMLKEKRQNIMFSATMTEEVAVLIEDYFVKPVKIAIEVSGTPLHNIAQSVYSVPNFNTKVNLLMELLKDKEEYEKVLVFMANKKHADRLFEEMEEEMGNETCIIHSNKSQNYRIRSVKQFDEGDNRILIATDVMSRGLDLSDISHVVSFDTPLFPENYMHRIGRTGRAEKKGKSLLFYTEKEEENKLAIEVLMSYEIPQLEIPESVKISTELIADERPAELEVFKKQKRKNLDEGGGAFHEKKEKNKKENQGGSYKFKGKTYKKPKTRGDKNMNTKKRR